jgi:alpha-glucosidase
MKDFGYDVANYTDVDPLFGTLEDFDRLVEEAHRRGLKVIIDQVLSHSSDQHPWFRESRSNKENPKADWYVWADAKTDGTPPNNWLSIFGGPAWEWDTRRCQYYFHNFLASQPDLHFHNIEVQDALLDTVEFWLKRGVDGFRLDTVNFYFHERGLSDNPAATERDWASAPAVNPYSYQSHLYDKSQIENLGFLKRLRALLDRYQARTTVGEVGDEHALKIMAEYTSGHDKLHMCYTFDFLSPAFSKQHFYNHIARFEAMAGDGWPCWAFSNHDVSRHVTRWASAFHGDVNRVARLAVGLLLSLRGSVCLYQGEELGLTEAELAFADLVDPYGIRFWPEYRGRDGCRTPMVWESNAHNCGFSVAKPWLPIMPEHIDHAANRQAGDDHSVLAHYRRFLAFRKQHPALRLGSIRLIETEGEILAFEREYEGERILCVFNLAPEDARFPMPKDLLASWLPGHDYTGVLDTSGHSVHLPPGEAFFGLIR